MENIRILVIEDEADIRDLLQMNLEAVGYDVDTAADGREAERKLKDMDIGRADKESEMEEQARGIGRKIWKRAGLWTKETAEIVMQRV